ncbi:hypothetical protein JXA05_00390, partial [Candidatus Peregrinibacteria bacterium]|nr:hypothetical protein [Candidatus Peregrinibacteria bacterium]
VFALISGCAAPSDVDSPVAQAGLRKPRIPDPADLKASVLSAGDRASSKATIQEMEAVLQQIETEMNRPNITVDDIKRGWYAGAQAEKKYGTPDGWVFVIVNGESRWASPNFLDESDEVNAKELCKATAGTYILSCFESDKTDCEYVPESECRCIDGSRWHDKQGCIRMDTDGHYVSISPEDLRRGWYQGLPNEKKLDTPENWVWRESGRDSRWQNPNPMN